MHGQYCKACATRVPVTFAHNLDTSFYLHRLHRNEIKNHIYKYIGTCTMYNVHCAYVIRYYNTITGYTVIFHDVPFAILFQQRQ